MDKVTGNTSDGYHTFNELYEHRHLLFITLLNSSKEKAFKTLKNKEGEKWEGWFIAGLNTKYGQITYHLPEKFWHDLDVTELERNSLYDNHSSNDVLDRLWAVATDLKHGGNL